MIKGCGTNEALKGLQDKTKEMADTLTDAVDLDKLEEFKAKAEGIADEIKGKLVSQIPKPKNLQAELAGLSKFKDAIAVGAAVAAIEKDFGKGLAAGVLTGALKNILPPLLQGAAGVITDAKDAISGALGGKEFDICKNIPNLELDDKGEPVEKAKVEAKPNTAAETQPEFEATVVDSTTEPSTSGSQYTEAEYSEAKAHLILEMNDFKGDFNSKAKKNKNSWQKLKKVLMKFYKKNKKKFDELKPIRESQKKYPKIADMIVDGADISPLTVEIYTENYQNMANYKYACAVFNEVVENLEAINSNLMYRQYYKFHPLFANDDWNDKTKYPGHFIYKFYEHLLDPLKRDPDQYGFAIADKAIADFHSELMDDILAFWKRDDIAEAIKIVSDYDNAKYRDE